MNECEMLWESELKPSKPTWTQYQSCLHCSQKITKVVIINKSVYLPGGKTILDLAESKGMSGRWKQTVAIKKRFPRERLIYFILIRDLKTKYLLEYSKFVKFGRHRMSSKTKQGDNILHHVGTRYFRLWYSHRLALQEGVFDNIGEYLTCTITVKKHTSAPLNIPSIPSRLSLFCWCCWRRCDITAVLDTPHVSNKVWSNISLHYILSDHMFY